MKWHGLETLRLNLYTIVCILYTIHLIIAHISECILYIKVLKINKYPFILINYQINLLGIAQF